MMFRPVSELKPPGRWAGLCALLVVALLWYHDLFPVLRSLSGPQEPAEPLGGPAPLDMATDSVDDMYDGCRSEAASVADLFAVFEWHFNRNFSVAWALAERHAKKPVHEHLRDDHAVALFLYTRSERLRQRFDQAVKTGKRKYSTYGFRFHYLYFVLTDAVQVLHRNQTSCSVAYHSTGQRFRHDPADAHVRLGAFTLAGATRQAFGRRGNVSCFEIRTCFGADITHYSATDELGQVLVPPYEVFRVADVRTDDPRCSVVYKLQSSETPRADLNCELNSQQIDAYFGVVSPHWPVGSLVKMLICVTLLLVISLVLVQKKQKCFVATVLGSLMLMIAVAFWRRRLGVSEDG